jgi:hypothetical protein
MKINSISYSRLVSFGSYQNATFSATAEVGDEGPDEAMNELVMFIEAKAVAMRQARDEYQEAQTAKAQMQWEVEDLERKKSQLKADCDRMQNFLESHGVHVDNVPF